MMTSIFWSADTVTITKWEKALAGAFDFSEHWKS